MIGRLVRWLVLSFRLQRWEVLASVAGSAALAAIMLFLASQMRWQAEGYPQCPDPAAYVPGCERFVKSYAELSGWASQALRVSWGAPFGMGLVLGVPLVAREVEHRTAAMAWTLSRSRAGWLVRRVAFVGLLLVVLLVLIGTVADTMAAAIVPTQHLDRDFTWYGRRGLLIPARGVASLGLGVVIGAMVGRQLPAVLVAACASALLFASVSFGMDRWLETEAQVVPAINGGIGDPAGALLLGTRIQLRSGELVGWSELTARGQTEIQEDMGGRLYGRISDIGHPERAIGWDRQLVIQGDRYPAIVRRESAVVSGIGLLLGLAGLAVVQRRRPG